MSPTNSLFDHSYAFIVGISTYQNGIPPLKTAASDAETIAHKLESEHHYSTTLLLNQDATAGNLIDWFQTKLPQRVGENDRLLLYFAGHGIALNGDEGLGPQGFLIPQDATFGETHSYLPMQKVVDALNKLSCRHCLVILDCCFAGAFRWATTRKLTALAKVIHKERYDRFIKDAAWQVLTSASADQQAWDVLDLKDDRGTDPQRVQHSPFAAALIEALEGAADAYPPAAVDTPAGDGVLTATELYLYLRDRVEVATDDRNLRQTPGLWSLKKHDKGEFIFLTPGRELKLPPAPSLDDVENHNPYRGLKAYEAEQSHLFFGRTALTEKLYESVCQRSLTVVLGSSGSGKSSLVKAGLLPCFSPEKTPNWAVLPPFRPGESPFRALNKVLAEANLPQISQGDLPDRPTPVQSLAFWFQFNPDRHLLVVIDQFEELMTLCEDEAERHQFLQALADAIHTYPNQFHPLLTLRSDFEPQFRNTVLEPYWQKARFMVPAMSREELREAIEKPAEAMVVCFEPNTLVDQLIDEVAQMPGALPLLSFTLSELYLKLARRYLAAQTSGEIVERTITQADYDQLGGVSRSLTQRAEQEYAALVQLTNVYEQTVQNVMMRLVTITGEPARRRASMAELDYPEPENSRVKQVVDKFSAARLLISGTDIDGAAYIEPAHDVLVRGWQRLLEWKRKNLRNSLLQRELTTDAMRWAAQPDRKANGLLWHGDPRLPVVKKQMRYAQTGNRLNSLETKFIDRSIQRERTSKQRVVALATVVTTLLAGLALFANSQRIDAVQQRNASLARQLASQSDVVRENPDEWLSASILLAIESLRLNPNAVEGNSALVASMSLLPDQQAVLNLGEIQLAALSPGGDYVATVDQDPQRVHLWQVSSGQEMTHFDLKGTVVALAFSSDGRYLAIGSHRDEDTTQPSSMVQIWQVNGTLIQQFDLPYLIHQLVLSSETDLAITDQQHTAVHLWQPETSWRTLPFSEPIADLAMTRDKMAVVTGDTAQIWPLQGSQPQQVIPHEGAVHSVRFSAEGKSIVTASAEGLRVLEVARGREIQHLSQTESLAKAVFSPNGRYVATLNSDQEDGTVQIWQGSSNQVVARMNHAAGLFDLSFSADGKRVITANRDGTVHVWQTLSQNERVRLNHADPVTNVVYSPDGKYLATASNHQIKLWQTGDRIALLHQVELQETVLKLAYSPNGKYIAMAGFDQGKNGKGKVQIWQIKSGQLVRLRQFSLDQPASDLDFSSDSTQIAIASDKTAQVWRIDANRIAYIPDHDVVTDVAFSPDNQQLAIANNRGIARLVRLSNLQEETLPHRKPVKHVAFSPDGTLLATATGKTVQIWQLQRSSQLASAQKPKLLKRMNHGKAVNDVAFSAEGDWLATASHDHLARLWRVSDGQELQQLNYGESVKTIAFNPTGPSLAMAGGNTAQIWFYDNRDLVQKACQRVGRNFTADEWTRLMNQSLEAYRKTCHTLPIEASLIEAGQDLAERGDTAAAMSVFRNMIQDLRSNGSLAPQISVSHRDPKVIANQLTAFIKIQSAIQLLHRGKIDSAINTFEAAHQLDSEFMAVNDPELFNAFCWFGSLHQQAQSVMPACNQAIELSPQTAKFRESRAIARATTHDIVGAMQDLQTAIDLTRDPRQQQDWQQWIDQLRSGNNPFTKRKLSELQRGN